MIKEMKDFNKEDKKEVKNAIEKYLMVYDGKLSIKSDDPLSDTYECLYEPETIYTKEFNDELLDNIDYRISNLEKNKRKNEILRGLSYHNFFSTSIAVISSIVSVGTGIYNIFADNDIIETIFSISLLVAVCSITDCLTHENFIDEIAYYKSSNRLYKDDEEISLLKRTQSKLLEVTSYHKKLKDKYGRNM